MSTDGTANEQVDERDGGDQNDGDDESFLGALSIIGAISFCCIGLGTVVGTAALAARVDEPEPVSKLWRSRSLTYTVVANQLDAY